MDLLARFVGIMMVFVIYIAVRVEGAAYGEDCASAACADANNICDTGKTNLCICNTGFFRKTSAAECAAQKALNSACTDGQPAEQCKDTLAECRDESGFKCLCQTGNFESKDGTCASQIAALNGPCDATDPASDQCAVADAECRLNGTAKCKCKATRYVNVAACAIRKSPEATCALGECVIHATCDSGTTKCVCDAGYNPSPTISPTMCNGVGKVTTLPYMYVVPILVSMMFLQR